MILELLLNAIKGLLNLILNVIHLPALDAGTVQSVHDFIGMIITNGGSLIGLFVRWQTVRILLPIVVLLVGAKYIYSLVMWILRKIPMLGIN